MAKGFLATMMEHFRKEGQSLADFSAELKTLSDQDRADFKEMFRQAGIEIVNLK